MPKKLSELKVRACFVRYAPDKIRMLVSLVKGKEINQAINLLTFSKSQAKKPLISVLKNGLSQAIARDLGEPLYVRAIVVDQGPPLKRRRIIYRGRSTSILKRTSHIAIYLSSQKQVSNKKVKNGSQSKS